MPTARKRNINNLKNVEIRDLCEDDPALPDYLHIVKADNYGDAVEEMIASVQNGPANTAVWPGAANLVDEETRAFVDYWRARRSYHIPSFFSRTAQKSLKEIYEECARKNPKFKNLKCGQRKFSSLLQSFADAVEQKTKKSVLELEITTRPGFSSSLESLHIDGFHAFPELNLGVWFHEISKFENFPDPRSVEIERMRFIQTFSGLASIIADPKDWDIREVCVRDFLDPDRNGRKPVIYQLPLYALALFTGNPRPSPGSVHAWPFRPLDYTPEDKRFAVKGELYLPKPVCAGPV